MFLEYLWSLCGDQGVALACDASRSVCVALLPHLLRAGGATVLLATLYRTLGAGLRRVMAVSPQQVMAACVWILTTAWAVILRVDAGTQGVSGKARLAAVVLLAIVGGKLVGRVGLVAAVQRLCGEYTRVLQQWTAPRSFLSVVLSRKLQSGAQDPIVARTTFMDAVLPTVPAAKPHSHGTSAAARSAASLFIEQFGKLVGRPVFWYEMSAADQRHGRTGSRAYRWVKDLNAEVRVATPREGDILALVDVDYYVDMPHLLSTHNGNVVLYTFQPRVAAAERDDYSFCFNSDGSVVYSVSGGGNFRHSVWNWSTDNLIVSYGSMWTGDLVTTAYLVDRREVDEDHQLVNLAPVGRWTGVWAWLATILTGSSLERLNPIVGRYVRLRIAGGKPTVSTGLVGSHLCATVPSSVDSAVGVVAAISGVKLTVAQTQATSGLDRERAGLLTAYYREHSDYVAGVVCPPAESVRSYQFGRPEELDFDAQPAMRAFMSPLVQSGFVPVCSRANDARMVKARITSIASKVVVTPWLLRLMDEFLAFMIPADLVGVGEPTSLDEVWERQSRPSQRRILEEADFLGAEELREIKSFMKKESYGEVKDPRPISTINGVDKRDYSTFCYAFAAHLKSMPWYAFGKPPKEVAARVAEVCLQTDGFVNLTDLSRCDGRVSSVARDLERLAMLRFFRRNHHDRMLELMRSQYNLRGRTRFGVRYETGYARNSGSPETSIFNTMLNAFIAYAALRGMFRAGGYLTPAEAWGRLGVYGGDDGISRDVDPVVYEKAAASVGQVLTTHVVKRGAPGVDFLGRVFCDDVWTGECDSCIDVPRQLAKFHLCVTLTAGQAPLEKLVERLRSYALTDPNTPVLGAFVSKAVQLGLACDSEVGIVHDMASWWAQFDRAEQFPNRNIGGWMDAYVRRALPTFDFERFDAWLAGCTQASDLLSPPICDVPTEAVAPKATHVVDDVLKIADGPAEKRPAKSTTRAVKDRPVRGSGRTPRGGARGGQRGRGEGRGKALGKK